MQAISVTSLVVGALLLVGCGEDQASERDSDGFESSTLATDITSDPNEVKSSVDLGPIMESALTPAILKRSYSRDGAAGFLQGYFYRVAYPGVALQVDVYSEPALPFIDLSVDFNSVTLVRNGELWYAKSGTIAVMQEGRETVLSFADVLFSESKEGQGRTMPPASGLIRGVTEASCDPRSLLGRPAGESVVVEQDGSTSACPPPAVLDVERPVPSAVK